MKRLIVPLLLLSAIIVSCTSGGPRVRPMHSCATRYLDFDDSLNIIVSISPFDGLADTLDISLPASSIVCMSASYAAAASMTGCPSSVSGVSGVRFLSDSSIHAVEVGYDAALDYETILKLKPDVVLAYSTSSVQSDCWRKLQSLGVRVLHLYDFMEHSPLARAEYIRAIGRLVGMPQQADSVFDQVCTRYNELKEVCAKAVDTKRVLMNVPYQSQWFVPGSEGYMSQLLRDAGGSILGSKPGAGSSTISVEQAYDLSSQADYWLNPGWCASKNDLRDLLPLISEFPVLSKVHAIYNNTLRANPEGGNDFWESGALRPDLILEDLIRILHPELLPESELHYYVEVE